MSDQEPKDPELGRRERSKRAKRERILACASKLFARRGFDAVSTQEIADAADIGTGTLFRYFPTKADLLVEILGADMRAGILRAVDASEAGVEPVRAIVALIEPLTKAGIEQPENVAAYLRETLFGAPHLRAIGAAQGMAIPAAIERILDRYANSHTVRAGFARRDIADAIYARVWLEGIRVITQGQAVDAKRVEHTVELLIRGLLLAD